MAFPTKKLPNKVVKMSSLSPKGNTFCTFSQSPLAREALLAEKTRNFCIFGDFHGFLGVAKTVDYSYLGRVRNQPGITPFSTTFGPFFDHF